MSLFRASQRSLPRATLRSIASASRGLTTDSNAKLPAEVDNKQSSEITAPPQREVMVADVISGAPAELRHRAVRIYKPARNTMQSGGAKGDRWRIDFDILQGGGRWENPLMGWASSADYMQGTRVSFRSKEDAIHFAEKQGWDYYVQTPPIERIPPKNYSESFVYKPNKLRIARTK